MSILDELLVRLGVDADGLSAGAETAADSVEESLEGISDTAAKVGQDVAAAADKAAGALGDVGTAAGDAAAGAEQAAAGVEASFKDIAAAAAGAAVAGLFVTGLTAAMDITEATTRLQNQLGLTDQEAARAGDVAGEVFADGFGESVGQVAEDLGAVAQNLGGFANLSSKELGELTKDAEALAHTFEFDVAESTQAAGQLMKAGLAKDGGEAFDLITAAAQKLPPAMREEIPALTSEYSEFFRQLGFSGPEMFGLLAEAAKNPMFELDKLGDAVKEFTLLLADTGAVSEPLKELGLDVEHIQGLVDKGQGTRAFDEVTTALKNVENQTERTRLQAALFGGPGEDLGNTLLTISASSAAATSGMDDAAGATKKITDSMQASAAQAWESVMRSVTMTIGETLAPVLRLVADLLREHPGLIGAITPVVLAVAAALAVWAAAQWALNSALLANPMTWIILGIVALVAAIVVIATKTTWFQDMWAAAMDGVAAAWDWLWGLLQDGFKVLTWLFYHWPGPQLIIAHWDTIMDAVGAAIGWVNGKVASGMRWVLSAVGWLGALPGMAGRYFQGMANSAVTKTMALVDFVRSIPGRIRSALGDLGTLLLGAGRGIVQGLIDGITSKVGALRDQLGSITSMIPDWKGPMDVDMRLLTPSGEALMSGLMDGIAGQEPTLQRQLQAVTTSIPGNVTTGVARAAGPGGQGTVLEIASAGGAANDAILQLLLDAIRVRGGDPVEILTPRA